MDGRNATPPASCSAQHAVFVSAVEAIVTQINSGGRQRNAVFSGASKNQEVRNGKLPQSGLAQWSRFSRDAYASLDEGYVERLCTSLRRFEWGSPEVKDSRLDEVIYLFQEFIQARQIAVNGRRLANEYFGSELALMRRFGSGKFEYIEVANGLRANLEKSRREGNHIATYQNALSAIRKIDQDLRLAIPPEQTTDLCVYLLLPAAYGFFQSDQIAGQKLVLTALELAIKKGFLTPYAEFAKNTIQYQMKVSIARINRVFIPESPVLRFDRIDSYAAQAFKAYKMAYSIHNNSPTKLLTKDFGARCNAALEAVMQNASLSDNIKGLDQSAESLMISDIIAAEPEHKEQAARMQLTLAESYLNDANTTADTQESAIYKGFNLLHGLSEKTALEAKGTLLLARFHAKRESGTAVACSLGDRAIDLYGIFGANTRAKEARLFQARWEQKKRP